MEGWMDMMEGMNGWVGEWMEVWNGLMDNWMDELLVGWEGQIMFGMHWLDGRMDGGD